jgi:phospholipid transport system substrate-binding protein
MHKSIAVLLLALSVSLPPCGGVADEGLSTPEELVRSTSQRVLDIINKDRTTLKQDPARLNRLVSDVILPILDFDGFAKLTLGHHWRSATPEQRRRFTEVFKAMLMRSYASRMLDYAGTKIEVLSGRGRRDERRQVVLTRMTVPGKAPLSVNYSFRYTKGRWKAYNVTIAGLSLVQLFRDEFGREIDQSGLDALIERLERTNEDILGPHEGKPASRT